MVLFYESLMRQISVTRGMSLVEDDGSLALALEVEADLAEIVLVIGLEVLVGVVVFVVVVVETLRVQEGRFVVADTWQHSIIKNIN